LAVRGWARSREAGRASQHLETLKGMQLQSGGSVGTLLQNDATLTSSVDGELKGVKPIKTHYYSDGGVSLDIEVPLDELPPELAKAIKLPAGVAPLKGAGGVAASAQGQASPGGDVVVQTAQGQAAVLGGDKPAAREKAIEDALRHAVEMAVGAKVTSTSECGSCRARWTRCSYTGRASSGATTSSTRAWTETSCRSRCARRSPTPTSTRICRRWAS
jgi:hypothetical protein